MEYRLARLRLDNMAKTSTKQVTIAFFELLSLPDEVRQSEENWQEILRTLNNQTIITVDYKDGRVLVGSIIESGKYTGLSLSIDRFLSPRERQIDTGICSVMQTSGEGYSPAEETIVAFFERNMFGIVRSSQAAPSHAAVASWLNEVWTTRNAKTDFRWKASPIVREDMYNSVIKAKGMKITEATVKVEPRNLANADFGVLDALTGMLGGKEHGFSMAVTFQAGPHRRPENISLIEDTVEKALKHKELAQKISVKAKPNSGRQKVFDLLEDRVTCKVDLDRELFEAEAPQLQGQALKEIYKAYDSLSDILRERVPKVEH